MKNWIDLLNPDDEEIKHAGMIFKSPIPTRENLESIERSSKFDIKDGNIYVTIPILVSNGNNFTITPLGVILSDTHCLTLRYSEMESFQNAKKLLSGQSLDKNKIFLRIVECILDKLLDDVDVLDQKMIITSQSIFNYDIDPRGSISPRQMLKNLGRINDYIYSIKRSCNGILRALDYIVNCRISDFDDSDINQIDSINEHIISIDDITTEITNKTSFLLDSTLGFINIDQNNNTKLLTISSSILVAPTLVAGVYGMNFDYIPGLHSHYGYFFCLLAMVVMIAVPALIFWKKGWFKFQ